MKKYRDGILHKIGTHVLGATFGLNMSADYLGLTEGSIIGNPLYLPNEPLRIKGVRDNYLAKVEQVLGKWSYYDFYRNSNVSGYSLHERIGTILNPTRFETIILKPLFYKSMNYQIKQVGGGDGGRLKICIPCNPDDRSSILSADKDEYVSSKIPLRKWVTQTPFDVRLLLEYGFVTQTTYLEALKHNHRALRVLDPDIDLSFFYRDLEELGITDKTVYQVTPKGHCFIIPPEQEKNPKIKKDGKEDKKVQNSFGGIFA